MSGHIAMQFAAKAIRPQCLKLAVYLYREGQLGQSKDLASVADDMSVCDRIFELGPAFGAGYFFVQ